MTKPAKLISRRLALARLGLGIGAAYCAPMTVGLSRAHAASTPSSPSPPSSATPPSAPTQASAPEAPPGEGEEANDLQSSYCSHPSGAERATISRRDMQRAQAAVNRGEALPLREIVSIVQRRHPGRLIRVGFQSEGTVHRYRLFMVSGGGTVQAITVDAGSGDTASVRGC